jgi:hypothetical protein
VALFSQRRAIMIRTTILALVGMVGATSLLLHAQQAIDAPPRDVVTRLAEQLEHGQTTLDYRDGHGYLPSLLEHLDLAADSQVLVFSKTSFQQAIISPKNPRALYFNDNVAVGTVPGGDVYELLAPEPSHGLVFYTLTTKRTDEPRLRRRGVECVFCHALGNRGALSQVVASVIPDGDGTPVYTSTFIATLDDRTPFPQRWGGWYVTGTHGSQRHMGNAVAADPMHPVDLEEAGTQNVTSLADRFDVSKYLTGTSDIVALMVLEHQVGVGNRLNSLAFQYKVAKQNGVTDQQWQALDADIDDLVAYMLFVDEAPIVEPIAGVSTFTKTFPQRGPRDGTGRSLRDFDLQKRIFRYPLSYMIYSQQFDGLPDPIRERVYRRLYGVLTGSVRDAKYAGMAAADRQAVFEILTATKANLPEYWTARPAGF